MSRRPTPQLPPDSPPWLVALKPWFDWVDRLLLAAPSALRARTNWTPGTIASGSYASTQVTVRGALKGDPVSVGFSSPLASVSFYGNVTATNTVTIAAANNSLGSVDVPAGTAHVVVWRLGNGA